MTLLLASPAAIPRPPAPDSSGSAVRGVVRDASGSPIAGARLRRLEPRVSRFCPDPHSGSLENLYLTVGSAAVRGIESEPEASISTGSEGNFEISRPEPGGGPEIYLVTAEGFAPRLEVLDGASQPQVTLEKGSHFVLHLLTDEEKRVDNALATLIPLSTCQAAVQALEEILVFNARGDPDGRIEVQNVPEGIYALRVVAKGIQATNLAALRIGKGNDEFRVRVPRGRSFKGTLEFPPRTPRSSGTILAFWKDPDGRPQWVEGRFSAEDSTFALDGFPWVEPVTLLARTESGLSSRPTTRGELTDSKRGPPKPIVLRSPATWEGRLEENVKTTSLLVQPIFTSSFPPETPPEVLTVPVRPDRRFVVPEVSPAANKLKIVAPGWGETEVPLEEGVSMDLGIVTIPRRRTVEGTLVLERDQAWGSAEVEVSSATGLLCRARTTSEGRFACAPSDTAARPVRYRASAGGIDFRLVRSPGDASGLLVPAPGSSIQLSVSRPGAARPVKDLKVEIGSRRGDGAGGRPKGGRVLYAHSRTGIFSLHFGEEEPVRITVSNPEGGPVSTFTVTLSSEGTPIEIATTLPERPAVFGSVVAETTRAPIGDAEVELGTPGLFVEHAAIAPIRRTGPNGTWRFDDVLEGTYRLAASAPGYSPAGKQASVPGGASVSQEIVLRRPGRVRGKLLGLPKGGTASLVLESMGGWNDVERYSAEPDPAGQFVFEGVRPGRCDLWLSVRGPSAGSHNRSAEVEVRPGEISEVEFDLRSGIVLSGRAYLGEKPAPGAKLVFLRYSRKKLFTTNDSIPTDEEGGFTTSLPSAGPYLVTMFRVPPDNHGRGVPHDGLLEIGTDRLQTRDLRFSDARIRGRILDPAGKPIGDTLVTVSRSRPPEEVPEDPESPVYGYNADVFEIREDGRFEAGPLRAGEYSLKILAEGYAWREAGPFPLGTNQILELPDIVLDPEVLLRARVVDSQGLPLAGVTVMASSSSSFGSWWGGMKTGDDGEAILHGLSPGSYILAGLSREWPPAFSAEVKVPMDENAAEPILQFSAGGGLEVQVVDRSGAPIPEVRPRLTDGQRRDVTDIYAHLAILMGTSWSTDGEGRGRLPAVVPGYYSLKAGTGKNSEVRSVTVTAGQTARVTLVMAEAETP